MKYRIIEKIFEDGHKEYIAQCTFLNFGLFKIWRNYICDVWDYGYGRVRFICSGKTYEDCKQHILETIKRKSEISKNNKIVSIKKYNL